MKHLAFFMAALLAAQTPQAPRPSTFSTTANVVVVDVTVLDRDGKPIENLSKGDFLLYEDGKPQQLQTCDLQQLTTQVLPPIQPAAMSLKTRPEPSAKTPLPAAPAAAPNLMDHRLMILFFDLSSMDPPEQIRAADAAIRFLNTQMTSSDLVSIMTFGTSLHTVEDFTADRDQLIADIQRIHVGDSSDLATMGDTGADAEDQSGMYVADETEFNIFNTDRKLAALQEAAKQLGAYPEKKALVYLSSGVEKTGVDNQSQLRATVNTAVRANVAFYPIDARGLSASAPGGDATQAGAVGSNLYSGAGQRSLRDSFHNQQETLDTLAAETGGKALLDSNDLTLGMSQAQRDIRSYYVLTYQSTNAAEDGRYRRIEVRLAPTAASLRAKLDYRRGYYAPTTFAKTGGADREAQLAEALASENPITQLPIAVEVDYFRLEKGKYFVPISVKVPGSALSFRNKGAKAATELDFIAQIQDSNGKAASTIRDTIPLKLDETTAGRVIRGQIAYDTAVALAPGKYTIHFVARENGEGKIGTYVAPFTVPDLNSGTALRLSSMVLSNQLEPLKQAAGVKNEKKLLAQNPLITSGGEALVPNVTRAFHSGQTLRVYLEMYDPASPASAASSSRETQVVANLALYQGTRKVLETPALRVTRPDPKRPGVVPLALSAPMKDLPPGEYECQVTVIDQAARKFAFPRTALVILRSPRALTVATR